MRAAAQSMFLVVLIFSIAFVPTPFSTAQENGGNGQDKQVFTDRLLEILDAAKNRVEALFERLDSQGIPVPEEAQSSYSEGLSQASTAVQLRNEGRYGEANEVALQAMLKFRKAMQIASEAAATVPEEPQEVETAKVLGLREALERTEEFIERLESLAEKVSPEKLGNSTLLEDIAEARTHLENAQTLFEEGNLEEARSEMQKARSTAAQAMGELQQIVSNVKAEKAEKFLERAEERLRKLEKRMNRLLAQLPIPDRARENVVEALQEARDRIQEVRRMIEEGNIEGAIEGFNDVRTDEESSVERLEGHSPSFTKKLRVIEKLDNTIQVLEERIRTLKKRGVDVSPYEETILGQLEKARSLLTQAEGQLLDEGNLEGAEETINLVDEILDGVKEMIEEAKEVAEESERGGEESLEALEEVGDEAGEAAEELEKLTAEAGLMGAPEFTELTKAALNASGALAALTVLEEGEEISSTQIEAIVETLNNFAKVAEETEFGDLADSASSTAVALEALIAGEGEPASIIAVKTALENFADHVSDTADRLKDLRGSLEEEEEVSGEEEEETVTQEQGFEVEIKISKETGKTKIAMEKAEPNATYTVYFDGEEVGGITTNHEGEGKLEYSFSEGSYTGSVTIRKDSETVYASEAKQLQVQLEIEEHGTENETEEEED